MIIAITALVFLTILILFGSLYYLMVSQKRQLVKRLELFVEHRPGAYEPARSATGPALQGWRLLVRVASGPFNNLAWAEKMGDKLLQAGSQLRGSEFFVIVMASVVFFSLTLFVFLGRTVIALLIGLIIGYLLPMLILNVKIDKWTKSFNAQLSDALALISNSLRTGYSFMQSLEMVAREMPDPLSAEFERVLIEMNLGVPTEDALNNMAKRIRSDDLDLMVTAVLIQRQIGGNLSEILDNIATTIRSRVKIKGEIKTITAQGRISGLVIGILPIALGVMIYIINPQYLSVLFHHPIGRVMLAGAACSMLIGILIIRKIVNIEV